jgi:hypothetical protein
MKPFAVVLIANKRTPDNKYWVRCYNQEEVDKTVNSFSSDSYTEVMYY